MVYATAVDLAARWRPLTSAEQSRATTLLEDAAVRIDMCAPPTLPLADAQLAARKIVSCEMVKRARASGAGPGVSQISETRGPFTGQVTYANPAGDLYLTKADKRLLGSGGQVAGNVSLLGGDP